MVFHRKLTAYYGELQPKGTAEIEGAFKTDGPAHGFDQILGDRQADPRSGDVGVFQSQA